MKIVFSPIGTIHSPFSDIADMPIQPTGARGVKGSIEILPDYVEALSDLEGFSHIVLLYHFHKVTESKMKVIPFLDSHPRGVFSTRAPARPNPIGLSVVKLLGVDGNVLKIEDVDILDGTPLLDIKPYVPHFEPTGVDRIGWLTGVIDRMKTIRSDERFRQGENDERKK
jgi:tRNA-Thr(GGU) m(6)t(6)A37 methyltransferase TsaA